MKSGISAFLAAVLILLFTYTGLTKLIDPTPLKRVLDQLPVVQHGSSVVTWLLPTAEILTAFCLLLPRYRRTGFYLSLLLLLLFTAYLVIMQWQGGHLPCSCGGIIQQLGWSEHLWLNIGLILLTLLALYQNQSPLQRHNALLQ